jgi:ADP-dependent phosphofructokinase/glucokinase
MEHCTAEEWFVTDPREYARFTEYFSRTGSLAMGGQAGIAALHLARTGDPEVYCLAPAMGAKAAEMLIKNGVRVPGYIPGAKARRDDIHLIFEYKPGLVPLAGGARPRDNRFIASPKKTAENTIIPESSFPTILPDVSSCTRSFLSGYQYLGSKKEFIRAAAQIHALKTCNPEMRVHIECVSVTDAAVLAGLVHHILPAADSAGMNEHELGLLLGRTEPTSPSGLVQGILELVHNTGLARIHLHTFGYYLLVIRKDRAVPEASRAALLYAARVVADAARGTGTSISAEGITAIEKIREIYGPGPEPGIFISGDYVIIAVPTLIASGITKTAGLGDILSSTAFVADRF